MRIFLLYVFFIPAICFGQLKPKYIGCWEYEGKFGSGNRLDNMRIEYKISDNDTVTSIITDMNFDNKLVDIGIAKSISANTIEIIPVQDFLLIGDSVIEMKELTAKEYQETLRFKSKGRNKVLINFTRKSDPSYEVEYIFERRKSISPIPPIR